MSDVVVDTDVASAILKGQLPDTLARRLAGQRLAVGVVLLGEAIEQGLESANWALRS